MKVKDIKQLPEEFNFKSKINPFNIIYHAKEEKHRYVVTCEGHRYTFSKEDFRRRLLNDEYVVC